MTSQNAAAAGDRVSVLFVCLGNICRSPMAEGVFRHLTNFGQANQHPLIEEIDSCGTAAYHAGDRPDPRTMSVLVENGLTNYKHKARKVKIPEDFQRFDYVLAMDDANYEDLRDMVKRAQRNGSLPESALSRLHLYGEYGGRSNQEEVGDPYYGGRDGFETVYQQVTRCGQEFLKQIEEQGSSKL